MSGRRGAHGVVILAVMLASIGGLAATVEGPAGRLGAAAPALSGVARDAVGNVIEGVEVLVLSELRRTEPVARAMTDGVGAFRVEGLEPGTYRIAAVKRGYATYLGSVNTIVDRTVDLLLRPAAGLDPDHERAKPARPDWALRLPRRHPLRDIAPVAVAASSPGDRSALFADVLQIQLDQRFMVGESATASEDADTRKTHETVMDLASSLGERGSLRLTGRRSRASGIDSERDEGDAQSLRLSFSYDAGDDSTVDVNAYFDEWEALSAAVPLPLEFRPIGASKSWGYDAAWSKQIDAASRVRVKVDYRDAARRFDAVSGPQPGPALDGFDATMQHRSAGAEGLYESVPFEDHQLRVDFTARFVDLPLTSLVPAPGGEAPTFESALSGWSFGINAEDSWSINGPWTLIYGVGYRQLWGGTGTAVVAPSVGASWSSARLSMRGTVAYHVASDLDDPALAGVAPVRAVDDALGFNAEIEIPLAGQWRLRGAVSQAPLQLDALGYDLGEIEHRRQPLFITPGQADVRHSSLAARQETGQTAVFVQLSVGEASGLLTPLTSTAVPVHRVQQAQLDYRNGVFGIDLLESGTDLVVEFRRLREIPEWAVWSAGDGVIERSVEVRVMQDLMRMKAVNGSWRLLLALKIAELDGADERDFPGVVEGDATISANQVSTGLSVVF